MDFSRSIHQGQFPKCCDLCETDIRINWKCLHCNLIMCTKCKEKVHSKFQLADKHKIIDVKEVGQHLVEMDFMNIICENHDEQICVMFCASCEQLVCPKCIADVHNGHGLVQISEGYKIQKENILEIQIYIKSCIEELINRESKIKLFKKYEHSKYMETRNLIQTQNVALKMEVDKYTEQLIKELDKKWTNLQNFMDEEERKVTIMKTRKENQNENAEDLINSNDVYTVFKESKQMGKYVKECVKPLNMDFTTMPTFMPGEITKYNFGSLQDIPKDLAIDIHQEYTCDIDSVYYLSSCPDNSLWIGYENVINRVTPEGRNLKVMSDLNMQIYGMVLTPSNDLLLVTKESSRLKQITHRSGQVTDSVYSVVSLHITTVHVTKDYKVIVGARTSGPKYVTTGKQEIILMNRDGKHEKTYVHDRNKQPIFTYVKQITSSVNSTISVIDWLSDNGIGRVVVLGQDGDVFNTYAGHRKINSDDKPFKPVHVVTTPLDNIIVTDLDTDTLHILNSVGHLITCYNTSTIGILRPYSLSFTFSGQLYIGCTCSEANGYKTMLYKLGISKI